MPNESDNTKAALSILMDAFYERYAAATSWSDATDHFTTSEITEMFNTAYPIPIEDIFDELRNHNFICVPLPNQPYFVWLLKQR